MNKHLSRKLGSNFNKFENTWWVCNTRRWGPFHSRGECV